MRSLYLDMDGVVADFNGYAKKVLNKDRLIGDLWSEDEWQKLKDDPRIYSRLDKTPEADLLVDFCRKFAVERSLSLLFLTAVPKNNDVPWAFYDKVLWASEYYPDIPVMFGPYSKDKHLHCSPGDILIDDRQSNIYDWASAGGIAILHRGDLEQTMTRLLGS
jgi:5'(3')-deoxyribonucleotidase